jgi:hypothetical protein
MTDINDRKIANVDGTSHKLKGPLQATDFKHVRQYAGTTEEFKAIVITANRVAREFNDGDLDTCVLTSYALAAALTDLGYANARPVRVEAASFPDDRKLHAVSLGRSSGRRAPKGYWCGHLAVCIGQRWLLDPTLDQSNRTQWADAGIGVEPVAASLTPEFWDLDLPSHQRLVWVRFFGVSTRYGLVPQKGFARAGDARPSHWRPLAKEITDAIRGLEQATIPEAHHTEDTKGMITMPDKPISRLLTSMA